MLFFLVKVGSQVFILRLQLLMGSLHVEKRFFILSLKFINVFLVLVQLLHELLLMMLLLLQELL